MRMKCIRIFPEMWQSTLCPLSSSTRNIALGNGSVTRPSISIISSLPIGSARLLQLRCQGLQSRPHFGVRDGLPLFPPRTQLVIRCRLELQVSGVFAFWPSHRAFVAVDDKRVSFFGYGTHQVRLPPIPPRNRCDQSTRRQSHARLPPAYTKVMLKSPLRLPRPPPYAQSERTNCRPALPRSSRLPRCARRRRPR